MVIVDFRHKNKDKTAYSLTENECYTKAINMPI